MAVDESSARPADGRKTRGRKPKIKAENAVVDSRSASQSSGSSYNTSGGHDSAANKQFGDVNSTGMVSVLTKILKISNACFSIIDKRARQHDGGFTVDDLAPELYIAVTTMIGNTMQNYFPDHCYEATATNAAPVGNQRPVRLEEVAGCFSLIGRICQTFECDASENRLPAEIMPFIWILFGRLRAMLAA